MGLLEGQEAFRRLDQDLIDLFMGNSRIPNHRYHCIEHVGHPLAAVFPVVYFVRCIV